MLTFLYRAGWALVRTAAPLAATGDGKFARAVRGRHRGAAALADWASLHRDTARTLVWFHAASVGEGRQAEAVLVRLRAVRPEWQIVYANASASAESLARSLPVDFAGYVPADTVEDTALALGALSPRALIFSATDLWPELVRQAAGRGVRLGLTSATLAPTSSRRGALARAFLHDTYAALDAVGAIDESDATALTELGVRKAVITITGDTRHDAAAARVAAIDRTSPALRALGEAGVPLLVAGSTWPDDERVLLPAVALLRAALPLRLVIAPHEPTPEHLTDLERRLAINLPGAAVVRLSALESDPGAAAACRLPPASHSRLPPAAWDVCIVDRVGILADLYAAASVAFVGGGFHEAGLHSVIEPAALGVPVVFGPRWHSSRDARLLLETGGGTSKASSDAIAAALGGWLEDTDAREAAGAAARAVVESGLGAADRSVQLVIALVEG